MYTIRVGCGGPCVPSKITITLHQMLKRLPVNWTQTDFTVLFYMGVGIGHVYIGISTITLWFGRMTNTILTPLC